MPMYAFACLAHVQLHDKNGKDLVRTYLTPQVSCSRHLAVSASLLGAGGRRMTESPQVSLEFVCDKV